MNKRSAAPLALVLALCAFVVFCALAPSGGAQDKKISELSAATSISTDDLVPMVDDPGGTPATKKITFANFAASYNALSKTLTNTTFALGNNTLSGSLAEFNAALTGADFATLAGGESLTNKKLGSLTSNGFVKTLGGDGTLSVDTATYQTATSSANLENKDLTNANNTLPAEWGFAVTDETTAITTGTAKLTFRMPFAMTLTSVRCNINTVSSSGNPAIDINEGGASIFSTTLTIDSSEKTSTTAATPAVISDSSLADDAEITVDIDTAGTGAKGLKCVLIGTR